MYSPGMGDDERLQVAQSNGMRAMNKADGASARPAPALAPHAPRATRLQAGRRRLTPGPGRVLFVCSGNLCRSPMAQGLLSAQLRSRGSSVVVSSAGTIARAGELMQSKAAHQLCLRQAALPDFRTATLDADMIIEADLILTATRVHRASVVTLDTTSVGRTFTLAELARLLTDTPIPPSPVSAAALAAAAAARRGQVQPAIGDSDDLQDPYGGSRTAFERCARRIEELLRVPAKWLGGSGSGSGHID
jgi:protein-tyrosine phosphatase